MQDTLSFKTYSAKSKEIDQKWMLVDAKGKVLGRLASRIALVLRGKHKPSYTPHIDTGDYIVVINAEKIEVTGNKREKKFYFSHSQYPGGKRFQRFDDLQKRFPERIIEKAVKGMLPKGNLGRAMYRKLKVYAGENHPHRAQKLEKLEV